MASISTKNGEFCILLSVREFNELGFDPNKEYGVVKAKDGIWVITEEGLKKPGNEFSEVDARIFSLLEKKDLKERVEGKFEKFLNEGELKRFNELLKQGEIIKFTLSKKYTKAIYKSRAEKEREENKNSPGRESAAIPAGPAGSASQSWGKKPGQENAKKGSAENFAGGNLDEKGYLVIRNEGDAKRFSSEMGDRMKKGEIKGMKSFDGNFYVILSESYSQFAEKVLTYIEKKKTAQLDEIANDLKIDKTLAKIICEFLMEDGSLSEKRKGLYQYV